MGCFMLCARSFILSADTIKRTKSDSSKKLKIMNVYCFSGLGADERAFQFLNFPNHSLIHVPWIQPLKNESLESYAHRIGKIIDTTQPFSLIGLSFGGMLCTEIAKEKKPVSLILLSSIAGRHEMPVRMKIAGSLNLYAAIPSNYFTKPSKIANFLFGTKSNQERKLLNQILLESDPLYTKWALQAITKWKNIEVTPCFRVHGSKDRIFPVQLIKKVDYVIKGGGHLMIVSLAKEVSLAINACISTNNVKMSSTITQKQ